MTRKLAPQQVQQYHEEGYVTGIPVFDDQQVLNNRQRFEELLRSLGPGKTAMDINNNTPNFPPDLVYDVATDPRILDAVQDIIGPNILWWGYQFFSKNPGDGTVVDWHQDARYWPLKPHKNVTVWVAFDDSDAANGAMKVVPRTQRLGMLEHGASSASGNVLADNIGLSADQFDAAKAIHLTLKAGQISIHNDNLVHGSDANTSNRRRCGLTLRYMPTEVKCDLAVWPKFQCFLVRGQDKQRYNPIRTREKLVAAGQAL